MVSFGIHPSVRYKYKWRVCISVYIHIVVYRLCGPISEPLLVALCSLSRKERAPTLRTLRRILRCVQWPTQRELSCTLPAIPMHRRMANCWFVLAMLCWTVWEREKERERERERRGGERFARRYWVQAPSLLGIFFLRSSR